MLAAPASTTPIAVALVLALVAFGAFLPSIVKDSRRPLTQPRPVKSVNAPRRVRERAPGVVDAGQAPVPARRVAIALGALGALALWTTFGARTRRSARR